MAANILIVDDETKFERLMRQLFRRELRREDYFFTFAQNGLQALNIISDATQSFDLVLCDINMPEMDGLTFISELKKVNPDLLPVVVSAYGNMANIRAAMNLGAFDFVTKPVEFDDLKATIAKVLAENDIRIQAKKALKLEHRNQQLEELDELKSRFFTNISHELRTPVTIIDGMVDQIRKYPDRWLDRGTIIVKRNSRSLLNLINQILDLRKLEMGKLGMEYINGDIIGYLKYTVESFQSYAENKDIALEYQANKEKVITSFDPEKLLRVITNLISNAVKFTPQGGNIRVQVAVDSEQPSVFSEQFPGDSRESTDKLFTENRQLPAADSQLLTDNYLLITVTDTGIGIPLEKIPHIFERFYQIDGSNTQKGEGTGIGLTIVNEFVKMMNGKIAVESEENVGTTFTIHIPLASEQKEKIPTPRKSIQPDVFSKYQSPDLLSEPELIIEAGGNDLPNLLIVEDSPDIAQYLVAILEGQYQITTAENGQIGIERAMAEIPDIIISDVMMPEKNGYELCKTLKEDQRTSHIPIILLTAKADEDARIEGLESGADAYLPKPFNEKELEVRLRKLWELRMNLQLRYRSLEEMSKPENGTLSSEDAFILKFRDIVKIHISDENFGIPEMCMEIGMSRSNLHRKIKALTDRSTSLLIRSVRLEHAKKLLKTTSWNISQIAYEVGFKDPKYFTKTFIEEFGVKPSELRV